MYFKHKITIAILNLSHLSAHVVNRLLHQNRKPIPIFLSVKKTFQDCNPPDFKFYPSKLSNKNFPIWCNVKFSLLFVLTNEVKTDTKLTLHIWGNVLLFNLPRRNLKSGVLHF